MPASAPPSGPPLQQPKGRAFEHVNLRFNPFGELNGSRRAQVALLQPLSIRAGDVVQVMGEAGRGKTTHLLAWHHANPSSDYEYSAEGVDRIRTCPLPELFFVDEAQRLTRRELRRIFDWVPRLVIATHEDLSAHTRRSVRTLWLRGMDAERLAAVLQRRIEAARRGPGPIPCLSHAAIAALLARFGDDLRAVESYLYDVFQAVEEPGYVQV